MRTTLDIDAVVLAQLKVRQEREGKSMGKLVSELPARQLAQDEAAGGAGNRTDVGWIVGNLGVGVDLDDKDAVWAILDSER